MISAFLAGGLLAATPPVIVDDRSEFPWVVAAQAADRCGVVRVAQAARPISHLELATRLGASLPPPAATFASALPLVPTPSLFGVEGAALIALAEVVQRRFGVAGPVSLDVDVDGARLRWQVPVGARIVVDDDDIAAAVQRAPSIVAEQDATVGQRALRHSRAFSCFGRAASDAIPSAPLIRARFASSSTAP
jgi:hypothetical protein